MITENEFRDVYKRNWGFSRSLRSGIDNILSTVDYTTNKCYEIKQKITSNGEIKSYVSFLYFENWIWSWLNSINTNYSSIYRIIIFICRRENINLNTSDFFSLNLNDTTRLILNLIETYKQEIFRPGSSVFREMFFITQKTWNKGIISTIVFLHLMSNRYKISCNLNFNRGDDDDMRKGIDYKIFFSGSTRTVQHKSCDLEDEGGYFTSRTFKYNEYNYRDTIDLITIQSGDEINLFENSKDHNLIGERNQKFFIYKTLRIERMSIEGESKEIESILVEMNKICFEKNYIFMFEKDDTNINKFVIDYLDGIKTVRFFLNDIEDQNLLPMLREKLKEL